MLLTCPGEFLHRVARTESAYRPDALSPLAACNAGAVQKYNGLPPYPETRLYVEKVLRGFEQRGTMKADR